MSLAEEFAAFLAAQLDAEEADARAADVGGAWRYADGGSVGAWTLYDDHWAIATFATYRHEVYDYATVMPAQWHPRYVDADVNGRHAARYDPASVLCELDALRRLVEAHPNVNDGNCGTCVVGEWGYPTHGDCRPAAWPCETLRLVALRYAGRLGYRLVWAPGC